MIMIMIMIIVIVIVIVVVVVIIVTIVVEPAAHRAERAGPGLGQLRQAEAGGAE